MIYHETEHGVLYCGDCLDILPTLEDDSIDLTVTSPPYDNLREYGEGKGYCFTDSIFKPSGLTPSLTRQIYLGEKNEDNL